MRYQGRIIEWNDARGFGFVRRHGDETGKVFVHVRAFDERRAQPRIGDVVSYAVERDAQGRPRAAAVAFAGAERRVAKRHGRAANPGLSLRGLLRTVALALALVALASLGWQRYSTSRDPAFAATNPLPTQHLPATPVERNGQAPHASSDAAMARLSEVPAATYAPKEAIAPAFACSGKTYCSQMTSCAEATFYLRHCPGTLSDGDGDGIPCEDQWCGH